MYEKRLTLSFQLALDPNSPLLCSQFHWHVRGNFDTMLLTYNSYLQALRPYSPYMRLLKSLLINWHQLLGKMSSVDLSLMCKTLSAGQLQWQFLVLVLVFFLLIMSVSKAGVICYDTISVEGGLFVLDKCKTACFNVCGWHRHILVMLCALFWSLWFILFAPKPHNAVSLNSLTVNTLKTLVDHLQPPIQGSSHLHLNNRWASSQPFSPPP